MSLSERFVNWWSERLHIKDVPLARIPDYMYSVNYWLGSMVTAALIWQVITGLFLILYYVPSDPYNSTMNLINTVPYGALIVSTHLYGAYAMILLAYIHMFRNFFAKAYKKPRELQWMIGVILLVVVQGASFLGYSMTGDILATDAIDVGKGIMAGFPLGKLFEPLIFGNGVSLDLFTRLLGYHIILVALIGLLFGYHFYLAEMNGFMPAAKKVSYKAPAKLDEKDPSLNPWYPRNLLYMTELSLFTFGAIVLVPSIISLIPKVPILLSPFPSVSPSSPLAQTIPAYPPWFFLFLYKVLDFQPLSPFQVAIIAAIIPVLYFLLLPVLDRSEDLHFRSGWVFQSIGVIAIVNFIQTTIWGAIAPGVPVGPSVYIPVIAGPAALVFVGLYLISRAGHGGSEPSSGRLGKIPVFLLIVTVLAVAFYVSTSNSLQGFLSSFDVTGLPPVITGLLTTGLLGVLLIQYRGRPAQPVRSQVTVLASGTSVGLGESRKARKKLGPAYVLLTVLVATTLAVSATMWTFNPVTQAAFFGLGLGSVLLMLAEMVAVYHYVAYSRK